MLERFTSTARDVVNGAQDHGHRLRHPAIGTSHLLLSLVAGDDAVARLLADHGVTPARADAALTAALGRERPPGPAPATTAEDAAALAALGIDLDRIRAAVEAAFGPGALDRPAPAAPRGRFLHRRAGQARPDERTLLHADTAEPGRLPFSPSARKALELSLREAIRLGDGFIGTEHLLLGLLRDGSSLASEMLADLGVDTAALRAAVEEGRRRTA